MDNITNIQRSIKLASKIIMPLSPIQTFAAVNPWDKLEDNTFEQVARKFKNSFNIDIYPNKKIIKEAVDKNEIDQQIFKEKAWDYYKKYKADIPLSESKAFFEKYLECETEQAIDKSENNYIKNTVKKLYDKGNTLSKPSEYYIDDTNLEDILDHEMIKWSKLYLDNAQASWAMPGKENDFFIAWKNLALHDSLFTKNHKKIIKNLPNDAVNALNEMLLKLEISEAEYTEYFERHLLSLPGWAGIMLWYSEKNKNNKYLLTEYLATRISLKYILLQSKSVREKKDNSVLEDKSKLVKKWFDYNILSLEQWKDMSLVNRKKYCDFAVHFDNLFIHKIYLEAWEETYIKNLEKEIINNYKNNSEFNTKCQLAFCIDVRSEPFRRHIEKNDFIETIGVAGFFGLPIQKKTLKKPHIHNSLPVMIKPKHQIVEVEEANNANNNHYFEKNRYVNSLLYTFKLMKNNVFPSLLLPELSGPFLGFSSIVKSIFPQKTTDLSNKLKREHLEYSNTQLTINKIESKSELPIGFTESEKLYYAFTALKTMGLTKNFAPLVVLCGHSSKSENNPHQSSLQCGACGGAASGFNAKLLAMLCNLPEVRNMLVEKGICIPEETFFAAGEHITSTDDFEWIYIPELSQSADESLNFLKTLLPEVKKQVSEERLKKLPRVDHFINDSLPESRTKDWSEIRPEWGLAKNASFIIGDRTLTKNADLESRAFLHNYNWRTDPNLKVLNSIISGPALVAQWINLQYYASTVVPHIYGSGNKITQTITSGLGVMQGNASDLFVGLPWQSVMNSDSSVYHSPIRLHIIIQAPNKHVQKLLEINNDFKRKVQNNWVKLISINESNEWIKW